MVGRYVYVHKYTYRAYVRTSLRIGTRGRHFKRRSLLHTRVGANIVCSTPCGGGRVRSRYVVCVGTIMIADIVIICTSTWLPCGLLDRRNSFRRVETTVCAGSATWRVIIYVLLYRVSVTWYMCSCILIVGCNEVLPFEKEITTKYFVRKSFTARQKNCTKDCK